MVCSAVMGLSFFNGGGFVGGGQEIDYRSIADGGGRSSPTETVDIPVPSRQRTDTPKGSAFGDWDLRREAIVRQAEPSSSARVERYAETNEDDDELETPPFFRNR